MNFQFFPDILKEKGSMSIYIMFPIWQIILVNLNGNFNIKEQTSNLWQNIYIYMFVVSARLLIGLSTSTRYPLSRLNQREMLYAS
jgi:hypothetical protein